MDDAPENPQQPSGTSGHQPPPAAPPPHTPPPAAGTYYVQPVFVPAGAQPPPGHIPYTHAAAPRGPSNGHATASMIVSGASLGLLIFTAGVLAPITLIGGIIGTILGNKGKTDIAQGKTTQGKDESAAGFWMGIAALALSIVALLAWVVLIAILIAADNGHGHIGNMNDHTQPYFSW